MFTRYLPAIFLSSLLFMPSVSAFAEAEDSKKIVVTPNREKTPIEKVGGSITVIDQEQIQKSQLTHVSEILREVPGVDVVRSGGRGGNTSVFLRGANSEHTLVLLDGMELNNPSNTSRAFNFSDLTLENVEKIEILRGPQSGVYGSEAIGGVINIITKEAGPGASLVVSSEAGSFYRFVQRARGAYGGEFGSVSLGFTREDEDGISAAEERDGNTEEDGFENTSFTLRAKLTPTEEVTIDNTFRYNNSVTDLDNSGGVGGDDPNRELDNEQIFWRTAVSAELFDGVWTPTVAISLTDHSFDDDNLSDEMNPGETLDSRFSGDFLKFEWLNTIEVSEDLRIVAGISTEEDEASSRFVSDGAFGPFEQFFGPEDVRTNGYFIDLTASPFENFVTSAGVRLDDHDTFGNEVTFRISPVYNLPDHGTKFRGSVGTGFKAPSLNQLFSSFGNPDLEPEESVGWEFGIDQQLADQTVTVGATFYRNDIDNLITFNSETFVVDNIAEAEITGFEVYVEAEPIESFLVRADYTYLDAEDDSTNQRLIRRAENRVTVRGDYSFCENRGSAGVKVKYVGERDDTDFSTFPSSTVTLDSYTIVDLLGSYRVSDEIKLFARVENLFDENYQDVLGFGTYGVAGFGGIEVSL